MQVLLNVCRTIKWLQWWYYWGMYRLLTVYLKNLYSPVVILFPVSYAIFKSAFLFLEWKGRKLHRPIHFLLLVCRPKLKLIQNQIQEDVKKIMSQSLHMPTIGSRQYSNRHTDHCLTKPSFVASCSIFGPKVSPTDTYSISLVACEFQVPVFEHIQLVFEQIRPILFFVQLM